MFILANIKASDLGEGGGGGTLDYTFTQHSFIGCILHTGNFLCSKRKRQKSLFGGELTFWWEKQAVNKIIKKCLYIWQNLKYFRLCGSCSLCHNYSICFHSTKAATEKIHNEWAFIMYVCQKWQCVCQKTFNLQKQVTSLWAVVCRLRDK